MHICQRGKHWKNGYEHNSLPKRPLTFMSREEELGNTTSPNSGMSWMGMITPIGTHKQVQRIRTRPTGALSDHNAKEFYVHLTTLASISRRQQRRQKFQSHEHQKQHQDRIRDDLLQGPNSGSFRRVASFGRNFVASATKNEQRKSGLHFHRWFLWQSKQIDCRLGSCGL